MHTRLLGVSVRLPQPGDTHTLDPENLEVCHLTGTSLGCDRGLGKQLSPESSWELGLCSEDIETLWATLMVTL